MVCGDDHVSSGFHIGELGREAIRRDGQLSLACVERKAWRVELVGGVCLRTAFYGHTAARRALLVEGMPRLDVDRVAPVLRDGIHVVLVCGIRHCESRRACPTRWPTDHLALLVSQSWAVVARPCHSVLIERCLLD